MSVKAVAIALKLSLSGVNQFVYIPTWIFTTVASVGVVIQLIYLNKVITFSYVWILPKRPIYTLIKLILLAIKVLVATIG